MEAHDVCGTPQLLEALVELLAAARPAGTCGHTHVQKAAYVAQTFFGVPFDFRWTLYKYGPFSPAIRPHLRLCEREGRIVTSKNSTGLSISCTPGDQATVAFHPQLRFVADRLAPMTRDQMEKFATAGWVTEKFPTSSVADRAEELHKRKGHVDVETAVRVIEYFDRFLVDAATCGVRAKAAAPTLMDDLATRTAELYPAPKSFVIYPPRVRARVVVEIESNPEGDAD